MKEPYQGELVFAGAGKHRHVHEAKMNGHHNFEENGGLDFTVQRNPWKKSYTTRTQAWWDCTEYADDYPLIKNGTDHPSPKREDDEDIWDISDSLVDINPDNYLGHILKIFPRKRQKLKDEEIQNWLDQDTRHGFVRVYPPDENAKESELVPCDLKTTAQKICLQLGHTSNALHVQYNGDVIKRVDPYMSPLAMQNEYLTNIGYNDMSRIQGEGPKEDLSYHIKFYSGKPLHDYTYSRHYLAAVLLVRRGKMFHQWAERLCIISGTRLLIYKDKTKNSKPTIMQLAKGSVDIVRFKDHEYCVKLTAAMQHDKSVYLSFLNEAEFAKWLRKCKKATSKLPTIVDLSSCHLEFIPETVFVNSELRTLNLRHNVIRERPLDEDIYTIGWLDDIPRFQCLRSLNLADNDLGQFPSSVCNIPTLAEVNLSSNRIDEIPPEIAKLKNLQALHIHNNHLVSLPDELQTLERLQFLVIAFNNFTSVPTVMANLTEVGNTQVESIIMAGNLVEKVPIELLNKLHHVKKVDLRMNRLTLLPTETVKFSLMEHLTFLDIRDNQIVDLDIRCVRTLEYLNCDRNNINNLQVNGTQLKHLQAAHNSIHQLLINPKPEWLTYFDLSHNNLTSLPEFLSTCFFLQKLYANNNKLKTLPQRLFCDAQALKILKVDHNLLTALPLDTETVNLEEMYIHHNWLSSLPKTFLMRANKLKIFNASHNRLVGLPPPHSTEDLNKLQELYLSHNLLQDDVMGIICQYPRLKVLHLAYNSLYEVNEGFMERLELLVELNLSGNCLEVLPECLARFTKLAVLRAHSNRLRTLPDFSDTHSLNVLDVGSNKLLNVCVARLMDSQISLLDMSLNEQLSVSREEITSLKNKKKVFLVDSTGQNRALPGSISIESGLDEAPVPWHVGLAESTGSRNKLNIAIIKKVRLGGHNDAVFAMFDGGMNHEVPKLLQGKFLEILDDEILHPKTGEKYLKYAMLTAHRSLKSSGQKLGASATLLHINRQTVPSGERYQLNVANVGDAEAVMCRNNEVILLTRSFKVGDDRVEAQRVIKTDGFITEDDKVYGTCLSTRLLGVNTLYPHVIPDPHFHTLTLTPEDKFIILANKHLWSCVTYQEAVMEVMNIQNPVLAAKKLQDLAQSYGCKENISVLVIDLNVDDAFGYNSQSDLERSMEVFHLSTVLESQEDIAPIPHQDSLTRKKANLPAVKPLPQRKFVRKSTPLEWENILQERLSTNVKTYEVKSSVTEVMATPPASTAGNSDDDEEGIHNWTSSPRSPGRKYAKKLNSYITLPKFNLPTNDEVLNDENIDDSVFVDDLNETEHVQKTLTIPQRGLYQTPLSSSGGPSANGSYPNLDSQSIDEDSTDPETNNQRRSSQFFTLQIMGDGLKPNSTRDDVPDGSRRPSQCVKYLVSGTASSSDDDSKFDKIRKLTEQVFKDDICHPAKMVDGSQSSSSSSSSESDSESTSSNNTLEAVPGNAKKSDASPLLRAKILDSSTSPGVSYTEPDMYRNLGELKPNVPNGLNPDPSASTLVNMSPGSMKKFNNSRVIKLKGELGELTSGQEEPVYAVVNREKHRPKENVTMVILPRSPASPHKRHKQFETQELTFVVRDDITSSESGSSSSLAWASPEGPRLTHYSSVSSLDSIKSNRSTSVDVMTYL